jgi:hypothetical protein
MLDNAILKDVASKKMVTPAVRRNVVAHVVATHDVSEWRACRTLGVIDRAVAIDRAVLTMGSCALASTRWRTSVAGSATGDCSSCFDATASPRAGTAFTGSIARKA